MRRSARGRILVALTLAAALVATAGAHANATGAPENAAVNGCTCHGNEPSSDASVELTGLPDAYEAGTDYALTFTVSGPEALAIGQNEGGFQVIVSAGSLQPSSNAERNLNETTLTHGSAGNDQRSWDFTWSSPTGSAALQPVTFWYAGNAVNGDTTTQNDAWNKAMATVPSASNQTGNGTSPTDPADGDSPALGLALAGVSVAAAVVAFRRFDSDN